MHTGMRSLTSVRPPCVMRCWKSPVKIWA
jgi:hypothetical protein